jgi:hypothetical protein
MKIIQTLYTWGGERNNCGFSTRQDMLGYLAASYLTHSRIADYAIYTDNKQLAERAGIKEEHIIEVDWKIPGRWWNMGKLAAQHHHYETSETPAIHVDIDATLFDLPEREDGRRAVCEGLRGGHIMTHCQYVGLEPKTYMPRSGIIGFWDRELALEYCETALLVMHNWPRPFVDFEALWTAEELTASNLLDAELWQLLNIDTWEHLQGGAK